MSQQLGHNHLFGKFFDFTKKIVKELKKVKDESGGHIVK